MITTLSLGKAGVALEQPRSMFRVHCGNVHTLFVDVCVRGLDYLHSNQAPGLEVSSAVGRTIVSRPCLNREEPVTQRQSMNWLLSLYLSSTSCRFFVTLVDSSASSHIHPHFPATFHGFPRLKKGTALHQQGRLKVLTLFTKSDQSNALF